MTVHAGAAGRYELDNGVMNLFDLRYREWFHVVNYTILHISDILILGKSVTSFLKLLSFGKVEMLSVKATQVTVL